MMSASYKALLAISETHTRTAAEQAAAALAQKKAREDQQRKAAAAREAKEKAQKQEEIKRHFENLKNKQEEERAEQARLRKQEQELERREKLALDKLLHGPKKAKERATYPTSSSGVRDAVRKSRVDDDGPGVALTRDELRQRRADNEYRKQFNEAPRRSTAGTTSLAASGFLRKAPPGKAKSKRNGPGLLRGGATNSVGSATRPLPVAGSGLSAKERIAARPNDLILLQAKKRDVRSIDEIQRDLHASKSLSGEDAKQYDGWFGPTTKASKADSRKPSPPIAGSSKQSQSSVPQRPSPATTSKAKSSSQASTVSVASTGKKRARSASEYDDYSRSASPPAVKRAKSDKRPLAASSSAKAHSRYYEEEEEEEEEEYDDGYGSKQDAMRDQIWRLMGKDRSKYVSRDYNSDDDDMEAGALDVEREELRSAKIARKEEREAEEAERRAIEEKKRRKALAASGRA